jgi:hypothetical protein
VSDSKNESEIIKSSITTKSIGFGASSEFGAHVFKVNIPAGKAGEVIVTEDYGFLAGIDGTPEFETRVILPRAKWAKIADITRRDFNSRLRTIKAPPSTWKPAINLVDRMLGKELCVLMWASEPASDIQIEAICLKWSLLRPEERWWLYSMTAAEGGLANDKERGWRKALYYAFSDINMIEPNRLRLAKIDQPENFSLFSQ